MAEQIIFNMINVNALETNALIQIGENSATGWDSHNKNQMAVGFNFMAFNGLLFMPNNLNFITDNDVIDTPINDTDVELIDKSNIS